MLGLSPQILTPGTPGIFGKFGMFLVSAEIENFSLQWGKDLKLHQGTFRLKIEENFLMERIVQPWWSPHPWGDLKSTWLWFPNSFWSFPRVFLSHGSGGRQLLLEKVFPVLVLQHAVGMNFPPGKTSKTMIPHHSCYALPDVYTSKILERISGIIP